MGPNASDRPCQIDKYHPASPGCRQAPDQREEIPWAAVPLVPFRRETPVSREVRRTPIGRQGEAFDTLQVSFQKAPSPALHEA